MNLARTSPSGALYDRYMNYSMAHLYDECSVSFSIYTARQTVRICLTSPFPDAFENFIKEYHMGLHSLRSMKLTW